MTPNQQMTPNQPINVLQRLNKATNRTLHLYSVLQFLQALIQLESSAGVLQVMLTVPVGTRQSSTWKLNRYPVNQKHMRAKSQPGWKGGNRQRNE
jgi:hypothetical protein